MVKPVPHRSAQRASADVPAWRRKTTWLPLLGLIVATALLAAPSTPAPPTTEEIQLPPGGQREGLRTIVIDPGHGGHDTGALGPGRLDEKTLTLDIAIRLREVIVRRLGLNVILTRQEDVDVPLEERTEKANYWQADLFLSIHANSYRLGAVRGPETYFLSDTATDAAARRAADSENEATAASIGQETAPEPDLKFILWDLAQTQHLRESSLLAETVQSNMNELWQVRDRGVKQAPFLVLEGATMPAVLVEVGYLSNADDSARLTDPAFRQRIAETLYRSITQFRERYAVLVGAAPD